MASGTKFRLFSKLLDGANAPLWVISPDGRLAYLSAGAANWLGIDVAALIDRQSIAGAPVTDDPLDRLAASLSPPPGLAARGTASLRVQPPPIEGVKSAPIDVRFTRLGSGDAALTIAVGGDFRDREVDHELRDAVAIRQRLDAWRAAQARLASIVTLGDSVWARKTRRRFRVAASYRTDVGLVGPDGSGGEWIAGQIHQLSAPGETIVTVDGPLMDAELLEATLSPVVYSLSESTDRQATALVRGLDEMPYEAQQRLAELLATFNGRLRLLGLCSDQVTELSDANEIESTAPNAVACEPGSRRGVHRQLIETLSTLTIVLDPLSLRAEDLPLIATALIDALRAAGETKVERINRAALDAIVRYPWPRNMDELRQAIRSAAKRASGAAIAVEHLPLAIRSYRSGENPAAQKLKRMSLDDAVSRFEMRLIEEAVDAADGNRAEAARRLGISRARLLRRIGEADRREAASRPHRESTD